MFQDHFRYLGIFYIFLMVVLTWLFDLFLDHGFDYRSLSNVCGKTTPCMQRFFWSYSSKGASQTMLPQRIVSDPFKMRSFVVVLLIIIHARMNPFLWEMLWSQCSEGIHPTVVSRWIRQYSFRDHDLAYVAFNYLSPEQVHLWRNFHFCRCCQLAKTANWPLSISCPSQHWTDSRTGIGLTCPASSFNGKRSQTMFRKGRLGKSISFPISGTAISDSGRFFLCNCFFLERSLSIFGIYFNDFA